MNTRNRMIFILIIIIIIAGGLALYNWALGPTKEASGPIEAIPVQVDPTSTPLNNKAIEPEATPEEATPESNPTSEDLVIYEIKQDKSEVSFKIFEELRGQPNDVIGTTNQVAGQIALDTTNLNKTQVGEIRVNSRTLLTDVDRRNQAIRNFILNTDQYEFISFTTTDLTGLIGSAAPGQTFTFQINGDLKIRDISQPVTFDVTAQLDENNQITGSAMATINRDQYNLTIPNVPGVANVGKEITLTINFVAVQPSGG